MKQRPIPTIRWRTGEDEWTVIHEFYHSIRMTLCGRRVDAYNYKISDTGIERNPGPVECQGCVAAHARLAAEERAHWTLEYNEKLSESFGAPFFENGQEWRLSVEFYTDGSGVRIGNSSYGHLIVPSIDDFIAALQGARAKATEILGEDHPAFGTLTELDAADLEAKEDSPSE